MFREVSLLITESASGRQIPQSGFLGLPSWCCRGAFHARWADLSSPQPQWAAGPATGPRDAVTSARVRAGGRGEPGPGVRLPHVRHHRPQEKTFTEGHCLGSTAHKGSSLTNLLVVGGRKNPTGQNVQISGPGKSLYREKTANPQRS